MAKGTAVAAHLFIEILLSGQVSDRRVDSAAEILKNHGDMVLLGAIRGELVVVVEEVWPCGISSHQVDSTQRCGGGA